MRDVRDAKAMAHTLRAALATKGFKVTVSQSLELIAQAFGVADWNTLAATIRAEAPPPRNDDPLPMTAEEVSKFFNKLWLTEWFSTELNSTLRRILVYAKQRKHRWETLEHLLLGLIDDVDASKVMTACKVNLGVLKENLTAYIDNDLKMIVVDDGSEPTPTAGFQRAVTRAIVYAQDARGLGRHTLTGADLVLGIFPERESHAAWFLSEQGMTRQDAANFIIHGIVKDDINGPDAKGAGDTAA